MKPELNNQQSDWLNQAEELNDVEAAQVNGGNGGSFEAALAEFQAQNEIAQQRNLEMMAVQVEQGTALKAAKQRVNPK